MNWNSNDREAAREDNREVQEIQALSEQAPPTSLLSEVRSATVSLTDFHFSGYDLFIRLIRR